MKYAREENGKESTGCTMPDYFQITQEENGFHIIFFTKIYPDREEKKNQLFEEEKRVEFSLEDQSSLHSTVDIDDKNNCRSSSSKSGINTLC